LFPIHICFMLIWDQLKISLLIRIKELKAAPMLIRIPAPLVPSTLKNYKT
jgi:hypothetical protein